MPSFKNTNSGLEAMAGHLDNVARKATALKELPTQVKAAVAAAKTSFDVLDSLYAKSKETQNNFSKDFELGIQQVRLGVISIDEFIAKWGAAKIATADGFQTIKEQFEGADLGQYREKLQQLIGDIQKGGVDISGVIAFLKDNAGDLAKGLINILDLFKQGKASLEDVQRVLDATKQAFPGGDSDALAEAIRNALISGEL